MKLRIKSIIIIAALMLSLLAVSCGKPNAGGSSSEESSGGDNSLTSSLVSGELPASSVSSGTSSSPNSNKPIPPPPIKLSIASMPRRFGYMLNDEDIKQVKQILENGDISIKKTTGIDEFPGTTDNAFIIYSGYENYTIAEILRNTRNINELVKAAVDRYIYFYFLYYDTSSEDYKSYLLSINGGAGGIIPYTTDTSMFYARFLNPEIHEMIKKKLNVNEITEVLCFRNAQGGDFIYYKTDKGEYIYSPPFSEKPFVTFNEFIDIYNEQYPHHD